MPLVHFIDKSQIKVLLSLLYDVYFLECLKAIFIFSNIESFITVKIMILSRYRYRDAFFAAFFLAITEIASSNLYYYLRVLVKF